MAFALLNKRDPREVPYEGADISVPVGRANPDPAISEPDRRNQD